jgi:biotin carboxylase
LRELPLHGGRSSLRESAPLDPTLYSASRRLLEALDWTGLAMVEFKLAEGGPVLMEVNGRVWGSLPLAVHSGVDFPRRLAELYLPGSAAGSGPAAKPRQDLDADPAGREAPSPTPYAIAVQTRNLELELKWIVSMLLGRRRLAFLPGPSRREVVAALVSLLDPRVHSDVQSLADPAPGLADLRRIARVAVRWLRGERA